MQDIDNQCQLRQRWSLWLNLNVTAKDKNTDLIPNKYALQQLNVHGGSTRQNSKFAKRTFLKLNLCKILLDSKWLRQINAAILQNSLKVIIKSLQP